MQAALWTSFRRYDAVATALREPGVRELRRIAEQVGTRTLVLGTERAASGILRQADTKVSVGPRSKPLHKKAHR